MKNSKIVKLLFSMTGLIIISKILGFVKQMVVADIFGTTIETDLINLSQEFVGNIQYLLVQSLLTALVTVYIYSREEGRDAAGRLATDAFKVFSLIAAAVIIVSICASPLLARILAPTYDEANSAVLARYLRLFTPMLLPFVWVAIGNALLHAEKRFIPGEMTSVFQSLWITLIVLLLHRRMGLGTLIISFCVYPLWNCGYIAVLSRKYFAHSSGNPFRNSAVRRLLKMTGPLLLGYSLVYVNQLVDKILISGLDAGAVTAMHYGSVLSDLVGTFVVTFASILFPYITDRIVGKMKQNAAELTIQSAQLLSLVFLPVSILTVLCAEDIVTIVFARGAFGAESVENCAQALRGYGLMFVPLVFREVFSRFIYGYEDSKTPMVNSSISIVLNIVLSILLCPKYGIIGVTLASSISVCLCGVLNMRCSMRLNSELKFLPMIKNLPWFVIGGFGCALCALQCSRIFSASAPLIRFMLTTVISFAVYGLLCSPVIVRFWRNRGIYSRVSGTDNKLLDK